MFTISHERSRLCLLLMDYDPLLLEVWEMFHYSPRSGSVWQRDHPFSTCAKVSEKKKHLPPGTNTYVCVTRERDIRGHPLSKCARFSKKLTFLTTDTNTYVFVTRERDVKGHPLKALSQVWYNFWQLKALLKWWKMLFISPQKLFSFSRYLSFCLDFWSCFKMVWLKMSILNFMTSEPS